MPYNEIIYLGIIALIMLCAVVAIGMTFYLGRNKVKEIDRLVYGFEIPDDSIFFQILRLPKYGGVFASRWIAKRCHLTHIRDQFDKKFERPFIITHHLFMIGAIGIVLLYVLDKLFLHVTE